MNMQTDNMEIVRGRSSSKLLVMIMTIMAASMASLPSVAWLARMKNARLRQ